MDTPEWPLPPIRPEDLPLIRGLLSPDDYRKLLKRMADDPATWLPPHPDLLTAEEAALLKRLEAPAHERAPNAAWEGSGRGVPATPLLT